MCMGKIVEKTIVGLGPQLEIIPCAEYSSSIQPTLTFILIFLSQGLFFWR